MSAPEPEQTADSVAAQLLKLLSGKWIVAAIATAASMRLPHHLQQPRGVVDLALQLGCEVSSLERLLRVLASVGVVEWQPGDSYCITDLGRQLDDDNLGPLARFVGSSSQWTPWTQLEYSVRSGRSAFERVHGASLFEYLETHPREAELYDTAVDAFTRQQARALASSDLLGDARTVVDVGGGRGTFLLELLSLAPQLKGVLYDRPHVVQSAAARFHEAGLTARATFEGGNFFERVPNDADGYVLKHVLHNWSDERACQLLTTCADAMAPDGRVFVVEGLLLPGNRRDATRLMDLEMLVLTGAGRERSKPQFRQLLAASGLRLQHTRRLTDGAWLMVAARARKG